MSMVPSLRSIFDILEIRRSMVIEVSIGVKIDSGQETELLWAFRDDDVFGQQFVVS